MVLVAEIAMLVFGIISLAKGKFTLSRRKVVVGGPAYIVGILLMLPLPVSFLIGLVVGVAQVAGGGKVDVRDTNQMLMYGGIEFGVVVCALLSALILAFVTGKDPATLPAPEQYPYSPNSPHSGPQDPENPYSR